MLDPFSRYRALVRHLAESTWAHASTTDSPLALALPGAAALLHPDQANLQDLTRSLGTLADHAEAAAPDPPRLETSTHQFRPVYFPLAAHLLLCAWRHTGSPATPITDSLHRLTRTLTLPSSPQMATSVAFCGAHRERLADLLWRALAHIEAAHLLDRPAPPHALAVAEHIAAPAGEDQPLHPHRPDDQLDAWTYRELAGLQALQHLATLLNRDDWHRRAAQVARYHLERTQPDYTTYEPWAVHAFCASPETMIFVDQQLHDVATNLELTGPAAALMPALLLSDAAAALTIDHATRK